MIYVPALADDQQLSDLLGIALIGGFTIDQIRAARRDLRAYDAEHPGSTPVRTLIDKLTAHLEYVDPRQCRLNDACTTEWVDGEPHFCAVPRA